MKKLLIFLFLVTLNSCVINSIDMSDAEKHDANTLISTIPLNQQVEIFVTDSRIDNFDNTALAKQVKTDMSILSDLLKNKSIRKIEVRFQPEQNVSISNMNGYGLFPVKEKATMSIIWIAEYSDGKQAEIHVESRGTTEYFCYFFFPVGLYKIAERVVTGNWYHDVNFSLKFNPKIEVEEALVQLNRIIIKKVLDGKVNI